MLAVESHQKNIFGFPLYGKHTCPNHASKNLSMCISSYPYAFSLVQHGLSTWTESCAHVVCSYIVLEGPRQLHTAITLPNVARLPNDAYRSTSFIRGYILFVVLRLFFAKSSDAEYIRYGGWSRI